MGFEEVRIAILNTVIIASLCGGLSLVFGTLISIFLVRTNIYGRTFAWLAVSTQLAVPLYVFAGGWSASFGLQGWIRPIANSFNVALLEGQAGSWSALFAVAIVHALGAVPWVMLVVTAGLLRIDRNQEEQAMIDGGLLQTIRFSILPSLRPWLAAASMIAIVPVFTEMVVSNLFQVSTVTELVYLDSSRGTVTPLTYFVAIFLCILPILLTVALLWRQLPSWQHMSHRSIHYQPNLIELGRMRWGWSLLAWSLISLLVGLPIASLVVKAGWQPFTDADGSTAYSWTSDRAITTAQESFTLFVPEFKWTILLAVSSCTTALGIAGLIRVLIFSISRASSAGEGETKSWIESIVHVLMLILIATPGPLVGMVIIWILNRSTPSLFGYLYDQTLTAPVLAQQFRLLPIAWFLTVVAKSTISRESREQASLDGLSLFQFLRDVAWPQTRSLWGFSTVLLMILSIGELSCTILVLPPGVTTLAMRLFEMLHFGMRHQDSGLCGLLVFCGWFAAGALWLASGWKTRNDR